MQRRGLDHAIVNPHAAASSSTPEAGSVLTIPVRLRGWPLDGVGDEVGLRSKAVGVAGVAMVPAEKRGLGKPAATAAAPPAPLGHRRHQAGIGIHRTAQSFERCTVGERDKRPVPGTPNFPERVQEAGNGWYR